MAKRDRGRIVFISSESGLNIPVEMIHARYYNETRTHLGLDKDAPISRPVQRTGVIRSLAILGGLHHQHARA